MTEKQQERLQVCENNWVRRIAGVKRIDKLRMEELREEVGERERDRVSQGSWCERESHKEVGVRESHEEVGERESLTRKLV